MSPRRALADSVRCAQKEFLCAQRMQYCALCLLKRQALTLQEYLYIRHYPQFRTAHGVRTMRTGAHAPQNGRRGTYRRTPQPRPGVAHPDPRGVARVNVTIVDIAHRAKVAPSTVSRALSGKGRISPATRDRILRIAQELGYEGATALQKAIGILYNRRLRYLIGDNFYGTIMESVELAFRQWGYRVFFASFDERDSLAELFGQDAHDGCIVVGGDTTPDTIAPLEAAGTPVVLVDNEFPDHPTPAVVTANVEGSRALTRHLLSLGHKDIAYIAGPVSHVSLRQRIEGFRQVMDEAGLEVPDASIVALPDGHFGFETGVTGFHELWVRRGLRPTAVMCSNDLVALGVLQACHDLGLHVPGDISVAGFDDVIQNARPPLTTMKIHCSQMGTQAARLLYDLIRREQSVPIKVVVYPELRVRESTAPVQTTERGEAQQESPPHIQPRYGVS